MYDVYCYVTHYCCLSNFSINQDTSLFRGSISRETPIQRVQSAQLLNSISMVREFPSERRASKGQETRWKRSACLQGNSARSRTTHFRSSIETSSLPGFQIKSHFPDPGWNTFHETTYEDESLAEITRYEITFAPEKKRCRPVTPCNPVHLKLNKNNDAGVTVILSFPWKFSSKRLHELTSRISVCDKD